MNSFYTVVCVVSSVLTLSAISFDRFMAVICPLHTRVTQRKARCEKRQIGVNILFYFLIRYFIIFVWTLAVIVATPFLIAYKTVEFRVSEYFLSTISQWLARWKGIRLRKLYLANLTMFRHQ